MKIFSMISKMSCLVAISSALMLTGCTYAQMRVYNDPNSTQEQRQGLYNTGTMNFITLLVFGNNEYTAPLAQAANETLDCYRHGSPLCYNYSTPSHNYSSTTNCTRTYNMALHRFECI